MQPDATEADFERLSWHDNLVYALRIFVGDPTRNEWQSDLVLDIDHIVEWLCQDDGTCRFRVAPAALTFHNVTDVKVAVDCGDSGHRTAMNELSIDSITREPVPDQKICLDRIYYAWHIALNLPRGGTVDFGASGFTQRLRSEPVLVDQPRLLAHGRA